MNLELLAALIAIIVILMVAGVILKLLRLTILAAIVVAVLGGARLNSTASTERVNAETKQGTVTSVADGDTLTITQRNGERLKVRLLGIDTPELRSHQCGADAASSALRRLADGKNVTVKADPSSGDTVDKFGRYLGFVTDDGVDLGERQLRTGLARVYRFEGRRFSRLRRYRAAERAAQRAGRGLWTRCRAFRSARPRR